MNAVTRPSASVGTTPKADGSSTRCRAMVPSAPVRSWARHQGPDVEVGEDVAVEHEEPLVDAGVEGGEADGAGGVARLRLDGVVEVDAGAACRRGRRPGRRRAGSPGRARPRSTPWPARCSSTRSIIGRLPTGSICFGVVQRERAEAGAEAPDEHDRLHRGARGPRSWWWCRRRPWWWSVVAAATRGRWWWSGPSRDPSERRLAAVGGAERGEVARRSAAAGCRRRGRRRRS